jgi:poly-D-alanine transfer protein DltD
MPQTISRATDGIDTSTDFAQWNERRINGVDGEIIQWSVLQFNNGSATPFVIKCGATSYLELVVKAQAKMKEINGKEIVAVVPVPAALSGLSVEEIRQAISHLPESFCQLAMARTADGTRARYTRLYKTLAIRVPSLKHLVEELEESVSK